MQSRYVHIDIARGLGILLVVLGHNWIVFNPRGELFNVIYSFHMPLFFVLAGLFFRQGSRLSALFMARMDALIKPYLVTLILFAAALLAAGQLELADYFQRIFHGTGESLRTLYGEEGKTVYWTPLWFLPHLLVLTLAAWVAVALALAARLTESQQCAALAVLFLAGIYLIKQQWVSSFGLPFSLDLVPVTLVFFLIGYGARSLLLEFRPRSAMVAAALVVFSACHLLFNETIDLNQRYYSHGLVSTLQVATGIYLVMALSCFLGRRGLVAKVLAYVGEASLIILVFHSFVQIKTFYLVSTGMGIEGWLPALIAFLVASVLPVLMYHFFKRIWPLSIIYFPLKTGRSARSVSAQVPAADFTQKPRLDE